MHIVEGYDIENKILNCKLSISNLLVQRDWFAFNKTFTALNCVFQKSLWCFKITKDLNNSSFKITPMRWRQLWTSINWIYLMKTIHEWKTFILVRKKNDRKNISSFQIKTHSNSQISYSTWVSKFKLNRNRIEIRIKL